MRWRFSWPTQLLIWSLPACRSSAWTISRHAVAESARVLVRGGHLCVALVYPFASAQDVTVMGTTNLAIRDPYLQARRCDYLVERDGLKMAFASMHRPLQDYVPICANW